MNSAPALTKLMANLDQLEAEMRRIGYWSHGPAPLFDNTLFSGVSFEKWLQFKYLPKLREAVRTNVFTAVPPYKVGLAALRQYDYHSCVPEAHELMRVCFELENLLESCLPAQDGP